MATQQPDLLTPVPTSLPEAPSDDVYTPLQWEVMKSILTAVIPSLSPQSSIQRLAAQGTIPDKRYQEAVEHLMRTMVSPPTDKELEEYLMESPYDNEVCRVPSCVYE